MGHGYFLIFPLNDMFFFRCNRCKMFKRVYHQSLKVESCEILWVIDSNELKIPNSSQTSCDFSEGLHQCWLFSYTSQMVARFLISSLHDFSQVNLVKVFQMSVHQDTGWKGCRFCWTCFWLNSTVDGKTPAPLRMPQKVRGLDTGIKLTFGAS